MKIKRYEGIDYKKIEQAIPEIFKHYKENLNHSLNSLNQYAESILGQIDDEESFKHFWNFALISFNKFSKDASKNLLTIIEQFDKNKQYKIELDNLVQVKESYLKNFIRNQEIYIKGKDKMSEGENKK